MVGTVKIKNLGYKSRYRTKLHQTLQARRYLMLCLKCFFSTTQNHRTRHYMKLFTYAS